MGADRRAAVVAQDPALLGSIGEPELEDQSPLGKLLEVETVVDPPHEQLGIEFALARSRADRPDVVALVGRMTNRLTAAQDTVRAMIDAADEFRFDPSLEQASLTLARKTNATEAVIEVARLAMEAGGGAAYSRANGVERLFRDIHGALYHPLPTGRQERFTGRHALGLDPVG